MSGEDSYVLVDMCAYTYYHKIGLYNMHSVCLMDRKIKVVLISEHKGVCFC